MFWVLHADSPQQDQRYVYAEFREQLTRDEAGWYEAGLLQKGNHPTLPTNKQGSLCRQQNLQRKLQRFELDEAYGATIEEQKSEGVVEPGNKQAKGVEFYIPHKPVVKEGAETTKLKLRIVYNASAKSHTEVDTEGVSLNDCLNPGPALQNNMWNVLVRSRAHPIAVNGDIKQEFLQVRVRVVFGLTSSSFLLGGVIEHHLAAGNLESHAKLPRLTGSVREFCPLVSLAYDARFRVDYFESIFRNSVTGVAWCYTISMAHISYIGFEVRVWG